MSGMTISVSVLAQRDLTACSHTYGMITLVSVHAPRSKYAPKHIHGMTVYVNVSVLNTSSVFIIKF